MILYANVGGLKSKMSGVVEVLNDHDPHLFLMTETQLRSNTGTKINWYRQIFYKRLENPTDRKEFGNLEPVSGNGGSVVNQKLEY